MLVILGGFVGSGRKTLAQAFAQAYGFHYYDLDQWKLRTHERMSDGSARERVQRPINDQARTHLYRRAIEDFPLLSKMYPDTVIDDPLHRSVPRDFLFSEAERFFSPVVCVWVESSDEDARSIIEEVTRRGGGSVQERTWRRVHMQKTFEPLPVHIRRFSYSVADVQAIKKLQQVIQSSTVR